MSSYSFSMRRLLPGLLLLAGCFNGPAPDCRDPAMASECQGAVGGIGGTSSGPGAGGDGGVQDGTDGGTEPFDAGSPIFDAGVGFPLDGGPPP
jgi:hypothetical protein